MDFVGLVAVVMVFSIPISAIITSHIRSQTKIKHQMIQEQIKLEKIKQENYMLETEKLRLELQRMNQIEHKDYKDIM